MDESETVPNWRPLEKKLQTCNEPVEKLMSFMWMRRAQGIEFYKHLETGRYILLDSTDQCWRIERNVFVVSDCACDLRYVFGEIDR